MQSPSRSLDTTSQGLGDGPCGGPGLITTHHQLAVRLSQLAKALDEGVAAIVKEAHRAFRFGGEHFNELAAEDSFLARPFLAELEDLVISDPASPLAEIGARLVLVEFPPQDEVRLLEDFLRVCRVVHEPQRVEENSALAGGQKPREPFDLWACGCARAVVHLGSCLPEDKVPLPPCCQAWPTVNPVSAGKWQGKKGEKLRVFS